MSADFRLGDWIVRPQRRVIECGDEITHIKPKSMAVFECLVAAGGQPVSRNELFDEVWHGGEVSDDTLTKCIVELRRAFGDNPREPRVIETIPKLGFRLLIPTEPLQEGPQAEEPTSRANQQSRQVRGFSLPLGGLLLLAAVLVVGASLSFENTRSWLSEKGTNLFMKTAVQLSPYELENQPGIAVLPFVNMSEDPENQYFSDGMSEEIINSLARTRRLPVIARSSSFQFQGQSQDVKEIGRLLGVSHVLEGSVRKVGDKIRLTTHLIDTETGTHVWAGAYQRELGNIFALQNEIAQDIVGQIGMALGVESGAQGEDMPRVEFMSTRPPSTLEAYELYVQGVGMITSQRPALMKQAPEYFDRAIALDGNFADAWAAKGYALGALAMGNLGSSAIPASVYPEAIAALRKALEIEPEHAFAMGWLGVCLMSNDFEWAQGMQMLKQSLALNPDNVELLSVYGFYLDRMQMEGAGEVLEKAYRLDPLGSEPATSLALHLLRQGRLLDAAALVETTLIRDREGYAPNYFSAQFNLLLGRVNIAEERLRKARLVANPVDLNLDVLEWLIELRQGKGPLPREQIWERMQTEHLHNAVLYEEWDNEAHIVDVFNLAIEQRHPALRSVLFGPKPPMMPAAEWSRIKEITGVTAFQSSR